MFGLEGEFDVLEVQRIDHGRVTVIIEQTARERPCPACGVITGMVKDRPVMRVKDVPASGQTVELWWRKRRLVCVEPLCPRRTFTQTSVAVRPRPPGDGTAAGAGGDRGRLEQPGRLRGGR